MLSNSPFGIDPTAFLSKIKLGYGLATKMTYVAVCGIISSLILAVTFAFVGQITLAAIFGMMPLLVVFWFPERLMKFAKDNGPAALTEGLEYVQAMQQMQAAKDREMIDITPKVTANTSQPQAIANDGKIDA